MPAMDRCSAIPKTPDGTWRQRAHFSSRCRTWRTSDRGRDPARILPVAPEGWKQIRMHEGAQLRDVDVVAVHARLGQLISIRGPQIQHQFLREPIEPAAPLRTER